MASYLGDHPYEWGKFQSQFNQEINGIFRDLMIFEKENVARSRENRIYKLKQLFVRHFRKEFVKGEFLQWSLMKPLGYPGDYKIIDNIYLNKPRSQGFERLYDNYFQMSTICIAVRNRKEDFKQICLDVIRNKSGTPVKIMDLASGPCRDVSELLSHPVIGSTPVSFHCVDSDEFAIEYARKLVNCHPCVSFRKQNAVRIALKNDIDTEIPDRYDLIFSTGLFDYLDYRISVRLVRNLRKLLKKGGVLAVSDVRDKFSNPSIYFMEWVADWNLIYREDAEFRQTFIDAGFCPSQLTSQYEQQGVMQYIKASLP
jgi:SAM-dependent methyltransferase